MVRSVVKREVVGNVSAFFTDYSAKRGDEKVEAIAVVVDGEGSTATLRFVVVDRQGRASIANADELDLYGAYPREDATDKVTQG